MNPKGFPKRLDSKTTCLRITVPENLDLALEGLIRKVLREQPKTDDIYAFAANYFETLLRIRDKAGTEYTATQLCPFHNDEEARDMIVLAGTFPRQISGAVKGKGPPTSKTETETDKQETDKSEPEKSLKSVEILKDSKSELETKQATPDLIKKLPLLAQNQGLNGEEVGGEKTIDLGPGRERTETVKEGGDEEEYLISDPIKEFVEKELLTEGNFKEKVAKGEAPAPSERVSPRRTAREGENEADGGAAQVGNADEKKGADGGDNPGATDLVGGVIHASEDEAKRKIDPGVRETDEKGVEERDAEGKIGSAAQPEAEGERPLQETQTKKEKEEEEETSKLRAEEESENKMELAPETEAGAEGVEAPLPLFPPSPGGAEKHAQEPVHGVSPGYTEADASPEPEGRKVTQTRSAASSEAASPKEKGIGEVGGVRKPTENKSETDAQSNTPPLKKTDEECPESSSLVSNSNDSKPVENGARAAETDKNKKSDSKEATSRAAESTTWSEEAQDLITEVASGRINSSETGSSPERATGVQEAKEGGASFEEEGLCQTEGLTSPSEGGESNAGRKTPDTRPEDPSTTDLKSTEGAKLTSASAVEAEHAVGQPQTGAEDSTVEPGEEGKRDSGLKAGGSEILKLQQLSNSNITGSDKESEPTGGDEEGKDDGETKLPGGEVKAKDWSLAERRESPGNQTSPEEGFPIRKAEDVRCVSEAPTEERADADGRRIPIVGISSTTEGPKSEEQEDEKQEAPTGGTSLTGDARRLTEPARRPVIISRETETSKPQEFKTEDVPAAENETTALANEELCSVVDINHLKKGGGNREERELAEPRPEDAAEECSAPEPEGSHSPPLSPRVPNGEMWRDNRNDELNCQQESGAEGAAQGKAESEELPDATAFQEPVKSETDKEKVDSSGGTPPETRKSFDPSAKGKQIIIVEEPEATNENSEESFPPGEIQIKTIQTHYYEALRVPEVVTREYRVHEVIAPTADGLLGAATPPPSTPDEMRESPVGEERSGRPPDDNSVPPTPKTSPKSDDNVSPYAEAAEARSHVGPRHQSSHERADSLLAADGSDRDARVSDSDDLPHPATPTSDVASNLLEFSFQAASETFLTNEKRFSSLERVEKRFVTPSTEEARKREPKGQLIGNRGIDEALPALQKPGKTEAAGASTEGAEVFREDGERPVESSGSPAVLSDGDPPTESAAGKPVPEPRPRDEDESAPDASRLPSGRNQEHAEEFQRVTAAGVESAKESFHLKTREGNVLESCPEEVQVGSRRNARALDHRSTDWTVEASYAETDSTTSSATTEVKRADSSRRDFASARSLSSARSLDLGKRSPLLRTRSLSTHRHGVADFEVWSTIEKELEEAAIKIQSKFRGYKARKKLRREVAVQISTEESSERSTSAEADDALQATGEFHDGIVLAEHPR